MSKINNVGLNLGQKIANPFKTSRNITTPNPFKYSNFEGNSLPFADVFDGFEQKKVNKLKMISSSVAGSMTKMKSLLPESIVNFVNRVRGGISSAWNYAKNISDIAGIKNISEAWNNTMSMDVADIGKGLSNSISGLGNSISNKMSFLNKDVTDIGKGLADKWNSLISSVHHNKITKDTPVQDLKAMWEHEINLMSEREAA